MIWWAVLGAGLGCYLLKLAGLSVPPAVLAHPVVSRVADLVPVALLAALVTVQVLAAPEGGALALDARVAALAFAVGLLWLRAPFLVVVFGSAAFAALLRLL
ncbi:AzlD domain-containing protein [Nocardioides sp. zg-536]|uniref:AzlD domain-containing protein n=1 Tax=Nocardioides faecalis TaxID=2803858 RepID=A0A939BX68_9ACTN|nr:AzlD domain-containing protein [Nocardioides faecalis]MBM9461397.1 AzlD domain-containing protein [Nocardioides faecalis]MBS4752361.1 AzlD domain-containing protein [Nocardioides faecalis]QVI57658.1 AzlD domain-containing protein [Nocardioides faecalis]